MAMGFQDRLLQLTGPFYPGLRTLAPAERQAAVGYFIRALVFAPLGLAGVIWLVRVTDRAALTGEWPLLAITFGLMLILSRLWFQTYYRTAGGGYRSDRRSFWGEVQWSAVLVAGPSAAWLGVILAWGTFFFSGLRGPAHQRLRVLSQSILRTAVVLLTLIEAAIYQSLGGTFPLPGLTTAAVFPAVAATLIGFSLGAIIMAGAMALVRTIARPLTTPEAGGSSFRLNLMITAAGPVLGLVSILPAGLYSLAGWAAYLGFWTIMVGATLAVDRLSRTVEIVQRRTAEMSHLEGFSRAVIASQPDLTTLPDLLKDHVPALFPGGRINAVLYPETLLLNHPPEWTCPLPPDFRLEREIHTRQAGGLLMAIMTPGSTIPAGHIYLESGGPGDHRQLLPALGSLSGQIASALLRLDVTQQHIVERVARVRADQELAMGARIQASLLPDELPQPGGWSLTATLTPALETSGDFYDVFPLGGGRLGLVVADVADKGLGAAFYMALSLTLLRSYAIDSAARYARSYPSRIGAVLETVNERLIRDTGGETFVTLFYAVLDPRSGQLWYANAGHNPPFVIRRDGRRRPRFLRRTGMVLGIMEEMRWGRRSVRLDEGDLLVIYTDGLSEAMNEKRDLWEERRLIQTARRYRDAPLAEIQERVLERVFDFMGEAPQSDDITLMLLRRER
jgi:serine phosphatase RsbU (regulator of sigma subunit)